jgi:SNF2 family DNA or RNA helicase
MKIEQRIGRIHRIGQTQDVFIFNFCLKGSIEEYILRILHDKIVSAQ